MEKSKHSVWQKIMRQSRRKFGICIDCGREKIYKAGLCYNHYEKTLERNRKWKAKNIVNLRNKKNIWRRMDEKRNPEKYTARRRRYRERHREECRERRRAYYTIERVLTHEEKLGRSDICGIARSRLKDKKV